MIFFIEGLENLTVSAFSQLLAQFYVLKHLAFRGKLYICLRFFFDLFWNGRAASLKYPTTVKITTGRNIVHDHHRSTSLISGVSSPGMRIHFSWIKYLRLHRGQFAVLEARLGVHSLQVLKADLCLNRLLLILDLRWWFAQIKESQLLFTHDTESLAICVIFGLDGTVLLQGRLSLYLVYHNLVVLMRWIFGYL